MRFPDELPDPREAVARGIRQAVANMREAGEALAGIGPGNGEDHVAGFAESYERWPDLFADRLERALRGLWVFVVKAGTGGAMFRSLQADFLRESAELLADDAIGAAARVYEEVAAEWVALADAVRDGDHGAGQPHVAAIARLEQDGVAALEACVAARA
jgi:hypothetical protein